MACVWVGGYRPVCVKCFSLGQSATTHKTLHANTASDQNTCFGHCVTELANVRLVAIQFITDKR